MEQEIDLDQITDENLLQSLLDQTDDPDDRKVIRDRIKELKAQKAQKKAEQQKKKDAEQQMQKKREMEQMKQRATVTPAPAEKTVFRQDSKTSSSPTPRAQAPQARPGISPQPQQQQQPRTPTTPSTPRSPGALPTTIGPKVDMVEDAIKKRQREAEERKKRILAAFDVAAKSAPAGAPKEVDFDVVNHIDQSQLDEIGNRKQTENIGTFQMSGGVPIVKKTPSTPSTPVGLGGQPRFDQHEEKLDAMERALRDRQRECEERKRRLLEQYQQVSRTGAGPKVFIPMAN